jgi:hypothetical protein
MSLLRKRNVKIGLAVTLFTAGTFGFPFLWVTYKNKERAKNYGQPLPGPNGYDPLPFSPITTSFQPILHCSGPALGAVCLRLLCLWS